MACHLIQEPHAALLLGCKNSIRHIENRFSPHFILFLFS